MRHSKECCTTIMGLFFWHGIRVHYEQKFIAKVGNWTFSCYANTLPSKTSYAAIVAWFLSFAKWGSITSERLHSRLFKTHVDTIFLHIKKFWKATGNFRGFATFDFYFHQQLFLFCPKSKRREKFTKFWAYSKVI